MAQPAPTWRGQARSWRAQVLECVNQFSPAGSSGRSALQATSRRERPPWAATVSIPIQQSRLAAAAAAAAAGRLRRCVQRYDPPESPSRPRSARSGRYPEHGQAGVGDLSRTGSRTTRPGRARRELRRGGQRPAEFGPPAAEHAATMGRARGPTTAPHLIRGRRPAPVSDSYASEPAARGPVAPGPGTGRHVSWASNSGPLHVELTMRRRRVSSGAVPSTGASESWKPVW